MKHLVWIKTSSWPWSFHLRKMNQPTSSISASSSLLQNCRCAVDNSLAPSLYPPPHLQFFRLIKNDRSEEGGHSKTKPIFGKDQTRIWFWRIQAVQKPTVLKATLQLLFPALNIFEREILLQRTNKHTNKNNVSWKRTSKHYRFLCSQL